MFPYSGSVFYVETKAADPKAEVLKFVKNDPYVLNDIVESYEVREFLITDKMKDFDRLSQTFLIRNWKTQIEINA